MKITKIDIRKFRGIHDQAAEIGKLMTLIVGRNGTQKSTLLGMLSQTFTIGKKSPLYGHKPLSGGNFRSDFKAKFRLSSNFDKIGDHEWSLHFDDGAKFEIESIPREKGKGLRFWRKGKRSKGDGYIDWPVIFLSLQRLLPLAETNSKEQDGVKLSTEEQDFFLNHHNKIMSVPAPSTQTTSLISGIKKQSIALNTDLYDWEQNSAGQDNLGKIIAAIISFRRLKANCKDGYKGGILVIDEIDATMHPCAQEKLFDFLLRQASDLNLQVIVTTHSLTLLRYVCAKSSSFKDKQKKDIQIVLMTKKGKDILIKNEQNYSFLGNDLNLTASVPDRQKIKLYTEDAEAKAFFSSLNKKIGLPVKYQKGTLGCDTYLTILQEGLEAMLSRDILILLDGDASGTKLKKIKSSNIFKLPGSKSPEGELAQHLHDLDDKSAYWSCVAIGYCKEVCFRDFTIQEILKDRTNAKKWFNQQKANYRSWLNQTVSSWIKANKDSFENFKEQLQRYYKNTFLPACWK